jgi:NTE family protein
MVDRHVILCLQGGGALAAYHLGVVRALQEAGIRPTLIAATSTGALNGAVLAGHRRNDPAAALGAFWRDLARPSLPFAASLNTALGAYGNPAMYLPRGPWLGLGAWDSLYDTAPLARTLKHHVDFDRLAPRLILTASDLSTGGLGVFDSARQPLDERHVLAASALPPTFPSIDAPLEDGTLHRFWDGSLAGVSPLAAVLQRIDPASVELAVVVDLFPPRGGVPRTMAEVGGRMLELLSADRSAEAASRLRRVVTIAPEESEGLAGAADFASERLARRERAGLQDARRALQALASEGESGFSERSPDG